MLIQKYSTPPAKPGTVLAMIQEGARKLFDERVAETDRMIWVWLAR